jgi:hypothetical protein
VSLALIMMVIVAYDVPLASIQTLVQLPIPLVARCVLLVNTAPSLQLQLALTVLVGS